MADYSEFEDRRARMVERQVAARGVTDPHVLDAMRAVPREAFVPPEMRPHAYDDSALPIGTDQTISQPYIVALMTEALDLAPGDKVLEVGAGSGYAAAVLAEIAGRVVTVERHKDLADRAAQALAEAGYDNVRVVHGDGTKGCEEEAPFDAIIAAAGAPYVPAAFLKQLKVGGRIVLPVGSTQAYQSLRRIRKTGEDRTEEEHLGDVRFVPLVGAQGWEGDERFTRRVRPAPQERRPLPQIIAEAAEPFGDIEDADMDPILERIGDARVVCLGEASHGTSEFYRFRQKLTRALIERKGFTIVAAEADWPDAARIDHYVRHRQTAPSAWDAFARFPIWMWRNTDVRTFVDWLHERNRGLEENEQAGFYGLDLYSLNSSMRAVIDYLETVDPKIAELARRRYGCFEPFAEEPREYGQATAWGAYEGCRDEAVKMLSDLLEKYADYAARDGARFLDAAQNARLVADAERYYRIMYEGGEDTWNLRDRHMFDTLKTLLDYHGPKSKAVVWAHNSHVGNAAATDMGERDQINIGQLVREAYGEEAYLLGFGTHGGTVAAASHWDGEMEVKTVRPSLEGSYERLCHDSGVRRFCLPLTGAEQQVRDALVDPHLERAIGVIYRPESERMSHYFSAVLPWQFDEFVWFDDSTAVTPLDSKQLKGVPDTYPFGV